MSSKSKDIKNKEYAGIKQRVEDRLAAAKSKDNKGIKNRVESRLTAAKKKNKKQQNMSLTERINDRRINTWKEEEFSLEEDVKSKCRGKNYIYYISFNYKSNLLDRFNPLTKSHFEKKNTEKKTKLKIGDLVNYVPINSSSKNRGKIIKLQGYGDNILYTIKFENKILGQELDDLELRQFVEDKKNNEKYEQLIKVGNTDFYFCSKTKLIESEIEEYINNFVKKIFVPKERPKKIVMEDNKFKVKFVIPEKATPGMISSLSIKGKTLDVKIPKNFKTYEYYTTEIDNKLGKELNANPKRMEEKEKDILFTPSYIRAEEYGPYKKGERVHTDLNKPVKPSPQQVYVIEGAKIVKNQGKVYTIEDGETDKIKNLTVNVNLSLKLKLKKGENESRREELGRQIHNAIMNGTSHCNSAMNNLRNGLNQLMDTTSQKEKTKNDQKDRKKNVAEDIRSKRKNLRETGNSKRNEERENSRLPSEKDINTERKETKGGRRKTRRKRKKRKKTRRKKHKRKKTRRKMKKRKKTRRK